MTDYQGEKAFKVFQKSLITDKEGRCVVSWPWKNQEIAPAKGYGLTWGRLRTTIRRLEKSPELLECYDEYIKTLLEERIIERIKNQNKTWRVSYLPHQAVIISQKSTTKLRVVFDASAKTNEGLSLNKCLYRGPAMMPSLVGILLRARRTKTKEVTQENLATYRFTRVSFGVVSSPFLLTIVIRHLLNEESSKLSAELAKNLCLDNVVLTARSELESNRKAQEAKELFKKAKMYLGEFNANYDIEMDSEQEITKKTATKLLGIGWNNIKDEFTWRWKISKEGLQTKRQILQFYAAIYDPLGLCPIILPWKLLVQDLWKKSVS
uniref:Reverse transcriptase domain-containing protein n=1 Tax=Loa loa TaxID=7209 RepID=A0A1I7V959_LOALO